jgi:membrane-associated phospholipid phosphatase
MESQIPTTRFAAWRNVIAADVAQFSALAGSGTHAWSRRVAAWFRFVHRRRPDERFAVFPGALRMAEIVLAIASVVVALVLVADPAFLAMLNSRNQITMQIFEIVTRLGASTWILYTAGAVILVLSIYPPAGLKRSVRLKMHDWVLAMYFIFTSVAFAGLLTNVIKNIVGRARPQFTPPGNVWFSNPFGDNYDFASFPSGHATTAGALAMALMLLAPKYRVLFALLGVWIAVSRPVLGVHFPSDIFAGLAWGAGFTWIYARSFARKRLLFAYEPDGSLRLQAKLGNLRLGSWKPGSGGQVAR